MDKLSGNKSVMNKPESLQYIDDSAKGGGTRYETNGYFGKKKHEIVEAGDYRLVIVNGFEERDNWNVKKDIVPEKSSVTIGNPIIIPVLDKKDNVVAIATGLGFAGGKGIGGKFENGEVVISKIFHSDGSVNEISDIRKFKVEIEHKERTAGEGKDKHSEIYTALKASDAEKLVKEVLLGKAGLTNVLGLHTKLEQLPKFPVEEVASVKSASFLVAGKTKDTNRLS